MTTALVNMKGDVLKLKWVLGQWLPSHCSSANFKLRGLLGLDDTGSPTVVECGAAAEQGREGSGAKSGFRVKVETAAGHVVARLQVDESATVRDVKMEVAKVVKQIPVGYQQFLVPGYERYGVLKDDSVLKTVVENILTTTKVTDDNDGRQLVDNDNNKDTNVSAGSGSSSSVSESVQGGATTSNLGGEICLCLVVSTLRWSKLRSGKYLQISDDGRSITLPVAQELVSYGIATIRLTEPGHFFTVRADEVPTRLYTTIGIACERQIPQTWDAFYRWRSLDNRTMCMSSRTSRVKDSGGACCVRILGNEPFAPLEEPGWQVGDEITVSLGHRDDHALAVVFSINGTEVYNFRTGPAKPPFIPLCALPHHSCLVLVGGSGQPLQ